MNLHEHFTKKNILIASALAILTLFALWIRLLPMFTMGNTDVLSMVASDDPLYNLRQVEQLVVNFPNYAWFDPMTLYPSGSQIYWGSLFPTLIALCCHMVGATTRTDIISVGLVIPTLLGALMVPIMYYVGKTCGDWKTGLISSVFIAVVTGQYYYRSLYGYMDHHIAEVFFSTLFCLMFMYVLMEVNSHKIKLNDIRSYKHTVYLSALAGVVYLLGLYTMPTMILFAMIVGIFTVFLFIVNMIRGKNSEYLLVINIVVFSIAILGMLLHGIDLHTVALTTYSIGHIYSYLGVISVTTILYLFSKYIIDNKLTWVHYIGGIVAVIIISVISLYFISPQLYNLFVTSFIAFFGQQAITNTVQEARGWSTANAWATFNYGLLLMLCGAIVIAYKNIKENHPHLIFALVWSVVMLYSTWQHVRYEYYLAVNVALLSAIVMGFIIELGIPDLTKLSKLITSEPNKEDNLNKEKPSKRNRKDLKNMVNATTPNYIMLSILMLSVVLGGMFIYISASASYMNGSSGSMIMNSDWKESLQWMKNNTPDEGVDYYKIYNADTYSAPKESYGVMSWWDYGHMIIYIADRIPNANPFQEGVVGKAGAAPYFISDNEKDANQILDTAGTRYVITDTEMDTSKFWAMTTWNDPISAVDPYMEYLLTPSQTNQQSYQTVLLNKAKYYSTMVSRLHNFDGSMTIPTTAYYVVYMDATISGSTLPVIVDAMLLPIDSANAQVEAYNLKGISGYHAKVLNADVTKPLSVIPALQHYRLVHESPTTTIKSDNADIKYVKTFEYVKGAHINGTGIISAQVQTNTGRIFNYTQESINGEFIVPYSTDGNQFGVKLISKYKIMGSEREYDVTEQSIMKGV